MSRYYASPVYCWFATGYPEGPSKYQRFRGSCAQIPTSWAVFSDQKPRVFGTWLSLRVQAPKNKALIQNQDYDIYYGALNP